jgi:hypothetical protein
MAVYTHEARGLLLKAAELCEQVNGADPQPGTALYDAVVAALREALIAAVQASGEIEIERRIFTSEHSDG